MTNDVQDVRKTTSLPTALCGERLTVETKILEVAVAKVVLHDGHERGHLAEKQHSVVGGLQLRQDAIEELELARGAIQVLPWITTSGELSSSFILYSSSTSCFFSVALLLFTGQLTACKLSSAPLALLCSRPVEEGSKVNIISPFCRLLQKQS